MLIIPFKEKKKKSSLTKTFISFHWLSPLACDADTSGIFAVGFLKLDDGKLQLSFFFFWYKQIDSVVMVGESST